MTSSTRTRPTRVRRARLVALPQLMAAAVEANPNGTAVVFAGADRGYGSLGYAELDERSNRLARLLLDRGIGPGDLVAIGIPRSPESVLAVWAVAKTGAGFVPVDPRYPSDRVAYMVRDSGAVLGLTVTAERAELPGDVEWLAIDTAAAQRFSLEPIAAVDRPRALRAADAAYVIYTSGSTGRPKGVVVTQAGLKGFCDEQHERYRVGAESRTLHFASPSFDASVLELLLALGGAATMVVADPAIVGGDELAGLLRRERVTHAFITPAVLASLDPAGLDELRVVVAGGEACPPELVRRWVRPRGNGRFREFYNGYGPTETTIMTNISGPLVPGETVTIGAPIRRVLEYVLDERLGPVPEGVAGELYITGAQLARGYHERRGLTAARFVANPFGENGSRLYRTGDLVRRLSSGEVEYLGRNDFQVKIRGFRIELGEIDAVLAAHESVDFAVTTGVEQATGATVLVAYVHAAAGAAIEVPELTEWAESRLPSHMVPTAIVVLEAIPLTPVGKLDRAALPAPVFEHRAYRAPETRVQKVVAEVIAGVLGADGIGLDDDFFELGGNSLLATQVATRIGAALETSVPARALFENTTVAGLAAAAERLAGRGGRPALTAGPRPARIPLSPAQQRMWFLNRFDGGSAAYTIPVAVRLRGEVDAAALILAIADVVQRHEVLRTVYPETDTGPVQVVMAASAVAEPAVRGLDAAELPAALAELIATPFDVTTEVPLRVALFELGPDEWVLAMAIHHVSGDGSSIAPLTRDLMVAYLARAAGEAPRWAPLPVQYADYSIWQRALLGAEDDPGSVAAAQLAYWRTALADLPDQLELPTDRPRLPVQSFAGSSVPVEISAEVHSALTELARAGGATLFMALHTALAVLLARLAGTDDVAVGTPIAGRGEAILDDLIGMFVNTLVLRTRLAPGDRFDAVLARQRESDIQAFANADVPFERLVEVLDPARSQSRHPLFQVGLSFQNFGTTEFELPGLTLSGLDLEIALSQFDLHLVVGDEYAADGSPAGISGVLTYATALFDRASAEQLVQRFLRLLDAVLADPGIPVGDIPLLDAAERRNVLAWNETAHPVRWTRLHQGFDERAAADPGAVALAGEFGELGYGELSAAANRVARLLRAAGVGPEVSVALALPRGPELVTAMLGVLRAGGAFVPLDPAHPAERVRHILDTARPAVLITEPGTRLPVEVDPRIARRTLADAATHSADPLPQDTVPDRRHPAYTLFTSGSTGRPKGVTVPHGAAANQIAWIVAEYGIGPADGYLQKTAPTFDLSIWGFFVPLAAGARMVLAEEGGERDARYIAELIRRHGVTVTDFVPSLLAVFAQHARPAEPAGLRDVLVIGEALHPETVAAFRRVSRARLHNLYGPTEAAVSITAHPVTELDSAVVPIGAPEWNSTAHVLDARLRPVPPGVRGELYLGGAQLARGYAGRPELTAERFVADPFGAGTRLYRTGDLVTRRADGELVYAGRADFQVKFRGQRIELGEIETALLTVPGVAQAVVLVADGDVGQFLAGYVTPAPGRDLDGDAVRSAVRGAVPGYMVPAVVTVLPRLPLNPSGKLDRKALPVPTFRAREFRAPVTAVEETVAGVFAEVLRVERVGLDDDFFELGGNSLLATQVAARLGAALDTTLPVRALFEAGSVAALAARAEQHAGSGGRPALTAVRRPDAVPLSLAQQRMWFLNRFDPDSAVYNIPIAVRLSGELDTAALAAAVRDLVARHEVLRTVYPETADGPVQRVLPADTPVGGLYPVAVRPGEVAERVTRIATTGFDVTTEVPLRIALFEVAGTAEYVLVFVAHHIAADGWSVGPLTRDLMVAYAARSAGAAPEWAPLPVQYADFGVWQRELLGAEDDPASLLAIQTGYWRKTLDGLPDELALPTDRPRPNVSHSAGASLDFEIPEELHRGLRRLAAEHNATLFMVLQAGLAVLLAQLSGSADIAIGTPVAGRGEAELDDLIGMFVNTLVLRTEVAPADGFGALLRRVRETDLAAFAHADVPFERLVEVLSPPRSQARHPLFQTALTLVNAPMTEFELPGLRVAGIEPPAQPAKFDLQWTLQERRAGASAPAGMAGSVIYATELFDADTVRAFTERFVRVLAAVVADAETPVGSVDLLDPAERADLTSRACPPPPAPRLLPELFSAGAPAATAVVDDGRRLTYRELNERANRLARLLIAAGVGAEDVVALAIPRSIESVVALAAVSRTGAAFLPIDSRLPVDRIAFMIADSGARIGLTVTGVRAALPGTMWWLVLEDLDTRGYDAAPVADADRRVPLHPDHPVHVIYTSGSTGRPKGVVVSHRALANFAADQDGRFGLSARTRAMHFASPSFDASLLELLLAMLRGGTLVIVPQSVYGGAELSELIREQRVTHAVIPPAALATFDPSGLHTLRVVIAGGEASPPELIARWAVPLPDGTVRAYYNGYGPTETTVDSNISAPLVPGARVTIGGPQGGTQSLVLNARLQPVPVGVAGELYIAGVQLARGYHARPGLTAERFVAHPYRSGERMYRTGDVVRWTEGGEVEYVGRADFQVKIRGFRIELGEIDAALAAHPSVDFAVTIGHRGETGVANLASYVVAARGRTVDTAELTAQLRETLPGYMVPAAITVLDRLPLTTVGKLDRKALPAPVFTSEVAFRPPRTPVEQIVADVFGRVLAVERVGLDDDFFTLGGNSLLATRVAARLGAALNSRVLVRTLFETSTVAELAAVLERESGTGARPALVAGARPERIPLSLAQQRMWFLNRFDPDSAVYNVPIAVRLTGELDIAALEAAVRDVVARHEVLRTVYPETADGPVQRVLPADASAIALTPVPVRAGDTQARVAELVTAGFDVTAEVPLRVALFEVAETAEYVLVFVAQHIAMDGWSVSPLTRDLMVAYAARAAGAAPEWAPLPVQYADFSVWQRELLGAEDDPASLLAVQTRYWQQALAELPDELALPTDRPRPSVSRFAGASVDFEVPEELHRGLRRLAAEHNATLFMVLQAGLAVLLAQLSGSADIAIGTPVAGRGEAELDDLIGMFVNTLVLRTVVVPDDGFDALLRRVKETDLAAFAHADVPFERLVEVLSPPRSQARHPLFQTALTLVNAPVTEFELPGLRVGGVQPSALPAKFDLQWTLRELPTAEGAVAGIAGSVVYATDLFDAATARSFAERFVRVLAAVVADAGAPVGSVDLLDPAERADLVARACPPPMSPRLLPELYGAGAPDAAAVVFEGRTLTYRELNERANRLARLLIARGVGAEDVVALAIPRSIDSVVTVAAVSRTGAAFLPIDSRLPADRIDFMLADSGARIGLTTGGVREQLPRTSWWVELADLELGEFDGSPLSDADRHVPLHPDHPVHVIYTSGSTGRPKGVVVSHGALANFAADQNRRFGLSARTRALHFASPSFDASLLELLLAILRGGTLVVVPQSVYGGEELSELIREQRVSHAVIPPAALATFDPSGLDTLRVVIAGGEASPPELIARWAVPLPDGTVRAYYNGYGPTETTVDSNISAPLVPGARVTIGGPQDGTQSLVLNARLQPVPVGVAGELYIGGVQLARGYLARPGLTAERFVANPFRGGERMYRTGDVVRWTRDGEVEYVGRSDFQVKIRGFRVELGEIDTALAAHGDVDFAVTVGHRGETGVANLVSYVVATPGHTLDSGELTAHLRETLPSYMIPAAIMVLDRLPLTTVGKLDRKALPAPVFGSEVAFRAPRTPVEQTVAEVFGRVLAVERVGLDDDFFALGGNSLLATRVAARLGAALHTRVLVRALFEASTVGELAAVLEHESGSGARPALVAGARPERIPLSLAQQRMWFLNRFDPGSGVYNVPIAVRLSGRLDTAALAAAVRDVLDRHEVLRTRYPETAAGPEQQVLPAAAVLSELPVVPVTAAALPAELRAMVSGGFDVTAAAPLRVTLYALDTPPAQDPEYVLVFVAHHIAVDGWSVGPLTRDLMVAYIARSGQMPPDWAPLPVQYADYSIWQRRVLGAESDPDSLLATQAEYWRGALAGLPDELGLPTDRPRPGVATFTGDRAPFTVDADLHAGILRLASERQVTVFMVVQAVLVVLLSRLSGASDVVLGTPEAGRGEAELDDLVGMFVNTVVLRTPVSPDDDFTEVLARVRETDLGAFAHADIPFERLVELLDPPRSRARHPLFQVALSLTNLPPSTFELPGLRLGAVQTDEVVAKFDLQWSLVEQHGPDGEPAGIDGVVDYATDLFDRSTVRSFADRFLRVLRGVLADPSVTAGSVGVLDPAEHADLVARTGAPAVAPRMLPELFTLGAPTAPAVVSQGETLTYGELNARSNRLARLLVAEGIGAEDLVAVGVPRSADSVLAALAVAKTGAAFVPIDPNYPAERIAHMVTDSGAPIGLTVRAVRAVPPGPARWLVLEDLELSGFDDTPLTDADRVRPVRPEHPAYVIYTSGSTGVPKGVVVTHSGLANFAAEQAERYGLGTGTRALHFASPSFDASILELLLALAGGGALVVVPPTVYGGDELAAIIRGEDVTHAFVTPAALATFEPAGLDSLRVLVAGGEACPPELVAKWAVPLADGTMRAFHNGYGPTETTIMTNISAPLRPGAPVTIGGPTRGMQSLILDSRLRPVPAGVPGELYLSGIQLARGYHARRGLTAARFVANPYVAGARMYRTGDVARWTRTGEVEYVGRSDFQVKVRGFRIEPGEIDAALATHESVGFAATVGHPGATGTTVLVSYVVGARGCVPDPAALTAHLGERLPGYMVPAAIMVLDRIPLTPVGKLDRAALPAPVLESVEFRAPSTPAEETVAEVFAEVLGIERVGADDDFFELGGNSLIATRVVTRLRERTGTELRVAVLFDDPTVAGVAARVVAAHSGDDAAMGVLLPIRRTGDRPPLFCLHPYTGLAWSFAGLARFLPADQPIFGLQTPALTEDDWRPASLDDFVERYVAEIRKVWPEGPYRLLGWSIGGVLAHAVAVRLQRDGAEVELLAVLDGTPAVDFADFRRAVRSAFAEVGIAPEALPPEEDLGDLSEAALEALAAAIPAELAVLDAARLRRIYRGAMSVVELATRHDVGVFRGRIEFFRATRLDSGGVLVDPAEWQPYTDTPVADHPVDTSHLLMTTPEALARIAPRLTEILDK
ncbi:non-ribosomal peptide synthetase [Nocardia asteroides]|uniref:non-ribosomal peptide synthetase n=1 Tax=Nocardia asteroides TaxID=1824 RepID=UPI001E3DF704|nr:non-ribosomal peptide synthetase [Nocardia asteroides]UGT59907.1 amino acid adenylation domain-containing protein [Nocardia asteroides]